MTKIVATQIFKREICTYKMAPKRKKTSHKNMANFPVMNVTNSPQLVYIYRLFHILPEMLKARPDRTKSSQDTAISTVNPKLTLRKKKNY